MGKPRPRKRRTKIVIEILLGSTPKAIDDVERRLSVQGNGRDTPPRLSLSFDHKDPPPADLVPATVVPRPGQGYCFIAAAKPTDPVSLRKAQQKGLIVTATAGWGPSARGAADNEGAGGIPREGFELGLVNHERLWDGLNRLVQQAIDYERRAAEVCGGNDVGGDIGRLTILLSASTAGGTGSGSLIWFLTECVTACARRNGVEPKIVLDLLSLGNLQTHDTPLARLDELITLKTLRAYGTGAYVHALRGEVMPAPFDHIRLYSNLNARGNQTSLKALVSHQAHLGHFIWNTPAGGDLQEREPDMVNRERSDGQDPMCVYTVAAAVHRGIVPQAVQEGTAGQHSLARADGGGCGAEEAGTEATQP